MLQADRDRCCIAGSEVIEAESVLLLVVLTNSTHTRTRPDVAAVSVAGVGVVAAVGGEWTD